MNLWVALAVWFAIGMFCLFVGGVFGWAAGIFRQGLGVGLILWGGITFFIGVALGIYVLSVVTGGAS